MLKFISLGCKVNSYESNALKELFLKNGFTENGENDIIVINTCSVTSVADQKSRQIIRRERRNNPNAILCVMGCYSQKNADYVKKECGADIVVQMPTYFESTNAEVYAMAGIKIASSFKNVTHICFGSESGDITTIKELATLLAKEPPFFRKEIKKNLEDGYSLGISK